MRIHHRLRGGQAQEGFLQDSFCELGMGTLPVLTHDKVHRKLLARKAKALTSL